MKKTKVDWKQIFQTARGIAIYPHLIDPQTKFNPAGTYDVHMKFEPADEAMLGETLTELYEGAYEKNCKKEFKTQLKRAPLPWQEGKEGTGRIFNFKMTATGVDAAGKPWKRTPQIFDARGNEVEDRSNLRIGSASMMLVMYRVLPFYTAMVGSGISTRLVGVRIFKLVDWKRDAKFYGFEEEDGWDSQASGKKPVPAGSGHPDDLSGYVPEEPSIDEDPAA